MSDPLAAFASASPTKHRHFTPTATKSGASDASLSGKWNSFFSSSTASSIEVLRTRAIEGKISHDDDASLRWLQWKLFLTQHISSIPSSWSAVLEREREAYNDLRCRLLRAPDGNYPPEVGFDGTHTTLESPLQRRQTAGSARASSAMVNDLSVNNPLSLDDSNPWKTYYSTLETRRIILQDVERSFPDLDMFRLTSVQQSLTNILFLWTLQNEDVGYRQGMHELAAVLWKVRSDGAVNFRLVADETSSQSSKQSSEAPFKHALADVFIEHDVYALFCVLMHSAKTWFAWRDSSSAAGPSGSPSTTSKAEESRRPLPIVAKCGYIFDLLRHIDPALAQHLEGLGIEPQIFCLRWIRMIFTREFALDAAVAIWDGLFASGGSLDLIDHVCIAMLLRIRNQLLAGDHNSALQNLLKYPQEAQEHPNLFIKQAIFLRDNARQPSTGVAVVMQNRDLLGIAVLSSDDTAQEESPERRGSASPPSQRYGAQKFATVGRNFSSPAGRASPWSRLDQPAARNANRATQQARPSPASATGADPLGAFQGPDAPRPFSIDPSAYLPGGISDLAKGWYERSELPQSLNSALANVSRTVAAAAGAYGNSKVETSGFPSGFDQAFTNQTGPRSSNSASTVGHGSSERKNRPKLPELNGAAQPAQPTSPPLRKSSENLNERLAKLTSSRKPSNKAISSALSICIDVLEQSWLDRSADSDQRHHDGFEQSELNTLMSFTALKHIRDVLDGTASEFDPATLPTPIAKRPDPAARVANSTEHATTPSVEPQQVQLDAQSAVKTDPANEGAPSRLSLPMSLPEYARYGRQMILPDFGLPGQLRLRRAKVLVVGAGGLGCPAIQYLAAAGVGQITMLDHDVVEPSNLARQILHSDATVGLPKAVSAANAAKLINPYIEAVPLSQALSAANARQMMSGQDLVLDCTDNPLTRYLISDAAVLEGVEVVSGAAQGYDGQLVVLHKRIKPECAGPKVSSSSSSDLRGPCYRCLFPKAPRPDEVTNCEDGGVLGGITGLVGTMQALEAVKILAGIGEATPPLLTLISPLTGTPFRSVKIRPRRLATCRSCGDASQVPEPMITNLETEDYASFCGLNAPSSAEGSLPRTRAKAMDSKALIVDVRPTVEYGIAKLDDSLNLPIQQLLKDPKTSWEKIHAAQQKAAARSVLVVCKKGNDSQLAVKALLESQKELEQQRRQQEEEAEKVAETNAQTDPLGLLAETNNTKPIRKTPLQALQITDLVGGLRAYSKEKDPAFPIY